MAEKHGKTTVIPGMEPTGHYWFALGKFLQDNGMKPMHVNPSHVKKSKELDDNNPNKNDRKDPKTIAALVNEGRLGSHFPFSSIARMVSRIWAWGAISLVVDGKVSNHAFGNKKLPAVVTDKVGVLFRRYFPWDGKHKPPGIEKAGYLFRFPAWVYR